MPEDLPDNMPEDMPDRMPDRMPEDMPEHMPEHMPDRMPDRMPEGMPEDMPDKMSDRMPEDWPVTKCINVMVGITRSKVILSKIRNYLVGRKLPNLIYWVICTKLSTMRISSQEKCCLKHH